MAAMEASDNYRPSSSWEGSAILNEQFYNTTTPMTVSSTTSPCLSRVDLLAIVLASIVVLVVLFFCFCWSRPLREQRASGIVRAKLQEEEEERRKQFVKKHLESVEWNVPADKRSGNRTSSSSSEGDEEQGELPGHQECPVCLTAFAQGQSTSCSTNKDCHHVFHRDCIYEWLLQKTECPMCRNTFLVEEDGSNRTATHAARSEAFTLESSEQSSEDGRRSNPGYLEECQA